MAFYREYSALAQHSNDDFGHFGKQLKYLKMNLYIIGQNGLLDFFSQDCFLNIFIVPVTCNIYSPKNFTIRNNKNFKLLLL